MENVRQVFWGHGNFLTPQHLQQQDMFNQSMMLFLTRTAQPHAWGVKRLAIRAEGLDATLFEVTSCEVVSRDGLVLRKDSYWKIVA